MSGWLDEEVKTPGLADRILGFAGGLGLGWVLFLAFISNSAAPLVMAPFMVFMAFRK